MESESGGVIIPLPHEAIATFGEAHQILKCIEELQELTVELAASLCTENGYDELDRLSIIRRAIHSAEAARIGFKVHKRAIDDERLARLVYEVADVVITLDQIIVMFGLESSFGTAVDEKKDRLRRLIQEVSK